MFGNGAPIFLTKITTRTSPLKYVKTQVVPPKALIQETPMPLKESPKEAPFYAMYPIAIIIDPVPEKDPQQIPECLIWALDVWKINKLWRT